MHQALILIDFINEIVHPEGTLSSKGYTQFIEANHTWDHLTNAVADARANGDMIIHVRIAFSPEFLQQPKQSPLFGSAHTYAALIEHTWATEFHDAVDVQPQDIVITKRRVNAFFGTELDLLLRNNGIRNISIAGVATDLAVASTVRDAHDRDYEVTILPHCCAAANIEDHTQAINLLKKVALIKES